MTTLTDPRSYVESRPVSRESHKGLRIAARSVTVYTCNVPDRKEVAKQNYLRRSRIMGSCGYNSVTYKPYETVGKVYLDNKKMILVALGQENDELDGKEQVDDRDISGVQEQQLEDEVIGDKSTKFSMAETQSQYLSSKTPEKLENIQSHLVKGRKMINAVRLGCNFFHLIKKEQKRLADEAERERERKLDEARRSMQILPASSCSDESDDEEQDVAQRQQNIDQVSDDENCQKSTVESARQSTEDTSTNQLQASHDENFLGVSDTATISGSTTSSEELSPRLRRKLRSSIRPYSAVYSNISYPELGTRESLFRQLCALNWILDAMSQDTFPPVVTPLTNCWNLRELRLELRASRKKVERERQTDTNWQSFLTNPSRFSQRENRRGITRRISVHPQHIQRLSAVTSSSSTGGPGRGNVTADQKTRRGSCASTNPETYVTENTTDADSEMQGQQFNEEGKKTRPSTARTVKSPEKPRADINILKNSSVSKSFTTIVTYNEERRSKDRRLSQRQLNQLTSTDGSEYPGKKAESRVNDWVRQTGQRNPKTRFVTAALTAFGTIAVRNCSEQVPSELKKRFEEVSEEKKIVLSDKLQSQNKKRWETLRRKFVGIDHSLHVHRALEKMRKDFSFVEPETREEMRQRVSEECRWYKDLIDTFPDDIKCDQYINFVLNKIAQYGSLEGRKTSGSHFFKVMATLRPWELCYPEIAAAIEFVRENIVGISTVEYDDWLSVQTS